MANLPTAHASQTFGNKSVDFYAAPGQVVGSDPRARADERRIQDVDGARHAVRLSEARFELSPGDLATVLRVQPGPARKSRPVAVVNYTNNSWSRTQPEAGALLAKAGVARNLNWLASILFLLAAMLVVLWPALRAFMQELFPAQMAALPGFDVFALTASALPDLAGWRLADSAMPLAGALEQTVPALAGYATALLFAFGVTFGAIIAFAARSWRLLWVPALIGAIGVGAIGLSGPSDAAIPAALALAGVLVLFLAGGAINRARDGWRLEQRIARLADHLLRHPPEEMVVPAGAAAHARADAATLDAGAESAPQVSPGPEAEQPSEPRRTATAQAAAAAARAAEGNGAFKAHRDEPDEAGPAESHETTGDEDVMLAPDNFVAREAEDPSGTDAASQTHEGEAHEEGEAVRAEDPRHGARDISLPPPPPMPKPAETLRPEAPLQEAGLPAEEADGQGEAGQAGPETGVRTQ